MTRLPRPKLISGGFTLLELMVAIIILSISVLGVAGVLVGTSEWQDRVDSNMELTTMAEGKLERLRVYARTLTSDTLQLNVGGSLSSSTANHADTVATLSGVTYLRRWSVANGPVTRTREVTLRVAPMDTTGHVTLSRDFTTIILLEDP
jgi:prepilin-type N-terminal cleavage/methylation domain-containing protein